MRSCRTATKDGTDFRWRVWLWLPVFAVRFPIFGTVRNLCGTPDLLGDSILRIFFPSRNRSFPHLRNRSGTSLASRMHKEKSQAKVTKTT